MNAQGNFLLSLGSRSYVYKMGGGDEMGPHDPQVSIHLCHLRYHQEVEKCVSNFNVGVQYVRVQYENRLRKLLTWLA